MLNLSQQELDVQYNSFLTFSLCSSEYVTVAVGVNDVFKSSTSNKSASVLLAFMVHTSKGMEEHEAFSKFLNEMFIKFCQRICLNLLVHDGEAYFRVYNTGLLLKNCITIRCDVHRLSNLKHALRGHSQDDVDKVKERLWGSKKKLPEGTVLKKGMLSCFSKYDSEMKLYTLIEGLRNRGS